MQTVFRVWPKRIKRSNGQVLTPEMFVIVTLQSYASTPFVNGANEVKAAYLSMYGFDYSRSCCTPFDFNFIKLG